MYGIRWVWFVQAVLARDRGWSERDDDIGRRPDESDNPFAEEEWAGAQAALKLRPVKFRELEKMSPGLIDVLDLQLKDIPLQTKQREETPNMMESDIELLPSSYYFVYARALREGKMKEFLKEHPDHPLDNQVLISESYQGITDVLQGHNDEVGGNYLGWAVNDTRPDGLPSLTGAFLRQIRLVYRYYPEILYPSAGASKSARGEFFRGEGSNIKRLPTGVVAELEKVMKKTSENYINWINRRVKLNRRVMELWGIQLIVNLRLDFMCSQMRHLSSGQRVTQPLAMAFAKIQGYLPDERELNAAVAAVKRRAGFRSASFGVNKLRPVQATLRLPTSPWTFLTIFGGDFLPVARNPYLARRHLGGQRLRVDRIASHVRQFRTSFEGLVVSMQRDHEALSRSRFRPRGLPAPSVDWEKLKPTLAAFRHLRQVFSPRAGSTSLRFFSGRADPRRKPGSRSVPFSCLEADLVRIYEVISDLCVLMPRKPWALTPEERFFVQCAGAYPVGTLVFIGHTTQKRLINDKANYLSIYHCGASGWEDGSGMFNADNPQDYLKVCLSGVDVDSGYEQLVATDFAAVLQASQGGSQSTRTAPNPYRGVRSIDLPWLAPPKRDYSDRD